MSVEPRLYIDEPLSQGAEIALGKEAAHYLVTVMRRGEGAGVRLFNGRDGEWRAVVSQASRKSAVLGVEKQLREQASVPDLALYFAPVKRARTDFIVEKATELGAASITPVMTRRTIAETVRTDRLAANATEAAEQTERLDLPAIGEPVALDRLLDGWDTNRKLVFCDEAGEEGEKPWGGQEGRARPMLEVLQEHRYPPPLAGELSRLQAVTQGADGAAAPPSALRATSSGGGGQQRWAILIGPEGGFDPGERELLRSKPFCIPVTLGPRILRADTAAAAALALWQAVLGDWNTSL